MLTELKNLISHPKKNLKKDFDKQEILNETHGSSMND